MSYSINTTLLTSSDLQFLEWNKQTVEVLIGKAPGSTLAHQVCLYEKRSVCDTFTVTIPYEGLDNGGVADIAVGQITGSWDLYGVWNSDSDRDGMSTDVGWSILFIKSGRSYFANYGTPKVWRSEDKKTVEYTYVFNVYTCEYLGADVPLPKGFSINTGIKTDLPGLKCLGSFNVVLMHTIKE